MLMVKVAQLSAQEQRAFKKIGEGRFTLAKQLTRYDWDTGSVWNLMKDPVSGETVLARDEEKWLKQPVTASLKMTSARPACPNGHRLSDIIVSGAVHSLCSKCDAEYITSLKTAAAEDSAPIEVGMGIPTFINMQPSQINLSPRVLGWVRGAVDAGVRDFSDKAILNMAAHAISIGVLHEQDAPFVKQGTAEIRKAAQIWSEVILAESGAGNPFADNEFEAEALPISQQDPEAFGFISAALKKVPKGVSVGDAARILANLKKTALEAAPSAHYEDPPFLPAKDPENPWGGQSERDFWKKLQKETQIPPRKKPPVIKPASISNKASEKHGLADLINDFLADTEGSVKTSATASKGYAAEAAVEYLLAIEQGLGEERSQSIASEVFNGTAKSSVESRKKYAAKGEGYSAAEAMLVYYTGIERGETTDEAELKASAGEVDSPMIQNTPSEAPPEEESLELEGPEGETMGPVTQSAPASQDVQEELRPAASLRRKAGYGYNSLYHLVEGKKDGEVVFNQEVEDQFQEEFIAQLKELNPGVEFEVFGTAHREFLKPVNIGIKLPTKTASLRKKAGPSIPEDKGFPSVNLHSSDVNVGSLEYNGKSYPIPDLTNSFAGGSDFEFFAPGTDMVVGTVDLPELPPQEGMIVTVIYNDARGNEVLDKGILHLAEPKLSSLRKKADTECQECGRKIKGGKLCDQCKKAAETAKRRESMLRTDAASSSIYHLVDQVISEQKKVLMPGQRDILIQAVLSTFVGVAAEDDVRLFIVNELNRMSKTQAPGAPGGSAGAAELAAPIAPAAPAPGLASPGVPLAANRRTFRPFK